MTTAPIANDPSHKASGLPFIPAALDDAGLDVFAFRVYCRIQRRGGDSGGCFESIARMARELKIWRPRARAAVADLMDRHMVQVESRPGRTSLIRLRPPTEWRAVTQAENRPGRKTARVTQAENRLGVGRKTARVPRRKTAYEGTPSKVPPQGTPTTTAPRKAGATETAETAKHVSTFQTVPATRKTRAARPPEVDQQSAATIAGFETAFRRAFNRPKVSLPPHKAAEFAERLRTYPREFMAGLPVAVAAAGFANGRAPQPEFLIRNGNGHYTRDGQTRNSYDWIGAAWQAADTLRLTPAHAAILGDLGILGWWLGRGATVQTPESDEC